MELRKRRNSLRLQGHDYSSEGAYFVTICIKDREHFFGEIIGDRMELSQVGKIIQNEWLKTPLVRSNVMLDEFVVMPDHFHAVVLVGVSNNPTQACGPALGADGHPPLTGEKTCSENGKHRNRFGPQSNNLPAIIRGFKGATTKQIHLAGFFDFSWQRSYHDRIIRNQDELDRIRLYIRDNPKNWNQRH